MITASKREAVGIIEEWAEEAEDGNYHGLSTALDQLAAAVAQHNIKGDLGIHVWTVKAVDGFLPDDNIAHIYIRP
jgi:hypothetical protein